MVNNANEIIPIRCVDSMYLVTMKNKIYNICVVALTGDHRKIASSMYASKGDVEVLYDAYARSIENGSAHFICYLSSGKMEIKRQTIPYPCEDGKVVIYNVLVNDGNFKSKMSSQCYQGFMESIKACYESMNQPFMENIFDVGRKVKSKRIKKKRNKGKRRRHFTMPIFLKNKKKGIFDK